MSNRISMSIFSMFFNEGFYVWTFYCISGLFISSCSNNSGHLIPILIENACLLLLPKFFYHSVSDWQATDYKNIFRLLVLATYSPIQ